MQVLPQVRLVALVGFVSCMTNIAVRVVLTPCDLLQG